MKIIPRQAAIIPSPPPLETREHQLELRSDKKSAVLKNIPPRDLYDGIQPPWQTLALQGIGREKTARWLLDQLEKLGFEKKGNAVLTKQTGKCVTEVHFCEMGTKNLKDYETPGFNFQFHSVEDTKFSITDFSEVYDLFRRAIRMHLPTVKEIQVGSIGHPYYWLLKPQLPEEYSIETDPKSQVLPAQLFEKFRKHGVTVIQQGEKPYRPAKGLIWWLHMKVPFYSTYLENIPDEKKAATAQTTLKFEGINHVYGDFDGHLLEPEIIAKLMTTIPQHAYLKHSNVVFSRGVPVDYAIEYGITHAHQLTNKNKPDALPPYSNLNKLPDGPTGLESQNDG